MNMGKMYIFYIFYGSNIHRLYVIWNSIYIFYIFYGSNIHILYVIWHILYVYMPL